MGRLDLPDPPRDEDIHNWRRLEIEERSDLCDVIVHAETEKIPPRLISSIGNAPFMSESLIELLDHPKRRAP